MHETAEYVSTATFFFVIFKKKSIAKIPTFFYSYILESEIAFSLTSHTPGCVACKNTVALSV